MFEIGTRRHNTGVRMLLYPDATAAHDEGGGGEDGGFVGSARLRFADLLFYPEHSMRWE